MSNRVCVFKSHHLIQEPKTSKTACVKVSKYLYLFAECFGNSHSYVQKKSSDDCHGVSANLKYLTSCYYIFNPILFIISFEGSPFGSKESMPVSYQNSQTSKEIGLDISIFVGSSVLYWHIVKQSSIFVTASILNLRFFV